MNYQLPLAVRSSKVRRTLLQEQAGSRQILKTMPEERLPWRLSFGALEVKNVAPRTVLLPKPVNIAIQRSIATLARSLRITNHVDTMHHLVSLNMPVPDPNYILRTNPIADLVHRPDFDRDLGFGQGRIDRPELGCVPRFISTGEVAVFDDNPLPP